MRNVLYGDGTVKTYNKIKKKEGLRIFVSRPYSICFLICFVIININLFTCDCSIRFEVSQTQNTERVSAEMNGVAVSMLFIV